MLKFNLASKDTSHSDSLRRYNKWFIQLRGYAVLLLLVYLFVLLWVLECELTELQIFIILLLGTIILSFNFVFRIRIKSEDSNQLRLSFWQIIFDLLVLSILVYFSGGIEAPIFLLFLFHMIIGSIILPKKIMYTTAGVLIAAFSFFSTMEFYDFIPHQTIKGFYPIELYKLSNFVIAFLGLFSFVVFMSIRITSNIVAELYNREDQLKRALDEIKISEQSKQKYVMAIVHELKSPIAAATSGLDIILGGYVGEVSNVVLSKINRVRERLSESIETINNILHVSRFKLFHELEKEEIPIVELIHLISEKYLETIRQRELELIIHPADDLVITADKSLISLCISNLVSNAVKYTPKKGRIEIIATNSSDCVAISIMDNGIGIPKEEHDKIFEDYYRASNVNTIEGTGTGLALIKQILVSHNGTIEIASPSEIGSNNRPGTEFIIKLPRI
jgi:signal transduction histidine kinase